jgi:hypothetical protein
MTLIKSPRFANRSALRKHASSEKTTVVSGEPCAKTSTDARSMLQSAAMILLARNAAKPQCTLATTAVDLDVVE